VGLLYPQVSSLAFGAASEAGLLRAGGMEEAERAGLVHRALVLEAGAVRQPARAARGRSGQAAAKPGALAGLKLHSLETRGENFTCRKIRRNAGFPARCEAPAEN
jgi:hypothetical protein